MGNETTYSGKLGGLTRLDAALEENATDLAHLEGPRARLGEILTGAQQAAKEQAAFTASKQAATKRFQELIAEGERLANGMSRFLRQHYGNRSEKLAEFGLQPFRGRKPAPAPTPTPTPTPANPATSNRDQ